MAVWAIADLHLSFGVPNKEMDIFGEQWKNHPEKIATHWKELITADDLVLLAGDISWGMDIEDALPDLQWIDALPGTKVMIKGNHDYWWGSISKVEKALPPSIHAIQNSIFLWGDYIIGGTRLWDTTEYNFNDYIPYHDNPKAKPLTEKPKNLEEDQKVFARELGRLEASIKAFDKYPEKKKIVMTHYPPIGAELKDSAASRLLEKHHVNACVFGHLHNAQQERLIFGTKNGVRYIFTACDYLNFIPIKIFD